MQPESKKNKKTESYSIGTNVHHNAQTQEKQSNSVSSAESM